MMKPYLRWHIQLLFGVFIGLGMGWAFQPIILSVPATTTSWLVTVYVYPDKPPRIESVAPSALSAPLSIQRGDSSIQVLDSFGQVLYRQTFQPRFSYQDLPQSAATERLYTFILPGNSNASLIQVSTPQGDTTYDLP